jgi:hypothetical protein
VSLLLYYLVRSSLISVLGDIFRSDAAATSRRGDP